jgi:hypothetical protein
MMTMRRNSGVSISGNHLPFFVSLKFHNPSERKTVKECLSTMGTTQWQPIYDRVFLELSSFPLVQFCLVYHYRILLLLEVFRVLS